LISFPRGKKLAIVQTILLIFSTTSSVLLAKFFAESFAIERSRNSQAGILMTTTSTPNFEKALSS
jgi:hypothetical protein